MKERIDILDLTLEELAFELGKLNIAQYRAEQIYAWLHRGVLDFYDMTNIPKDMRALLDKSFKTSSVKILDILQSEDKSTAKYLFLLDDGNIIEGVVMRYTYGNTICVSTQVGCKMGCSFCASTKAGFVRDLSAGEMIAQVLAAERHIDADKGKRGIKNIVLMGSGEPLDNYENTLKFLNIIHHSLGLNISYRNITLSTCGLVTRIYDLADEGLPITLSISLHAPNDELRKEIMPIAHRYGIDEIIQSSKYYFKKTGRRVTFEYALIDNVNDRKDHAMELGQKLKDFPCHVNLIPINEIRDSHYVRSSEKNIDRFIKILQGYDIQVTRRRELGQNIQGACGQLRRDYLGRYISHSKGE